MENLIRLGVAELNKLAVEILSLETSVRDLEQRLVSGDETALSSLQHTRDRLASRMDYRQQLLLRLLPSSPRALGQLINLHEWDMEKRAPELDIFVKAVADMPPQTFVTNLLKPDSTLTLGGGAL
ncbi:g5532 [Coccomyxa viridis]|uniref:G5532 protein n=1 Tax=Coccomyxa viridis TaxID=1274662 RepID=A0ABP1FT31_9CHLO